MRDARMVRIARLHGLEDRGGLELPRIGLVGRIGRFVERKRMKDRGLGVIRIARREPSHRGFIVGAIACGTVS